MSFWKLNREQKAALYQRLPEKLKNRQMWMLWKAKKDGSRVAKIPFSAVTGGQGMTQPKADFETVLKAFNGGGGYTGIGIYLKDQDLICIDIDGHNPDQAQTAAEVKAIPEKGLTGAVGEMIRTAGSYTEISCSGSGAHIIAEGSAAAFCGGGLEIYNDRFIALTGDTIEGYTELKPINQKLMKLLQDKHRGQNSGTTAMTVTADRRSRLTATEIEQKAAKVHGRSEKADEKARIFKDLYYIGYDSTTAQGTTAGEGRLDHSDIDYMLINVLCYWAHNNAETVKAVFEKSALYRSEYYQSKRDARYLDITVENCIQKREAGQALCYETSAERDFDEIDTGGQGKVKLSTAALMYILDNDTEFSGIAYDEFSEQTVIKAADGSRPLTDLDIRKIHARLAQVYFPKSVLKKSMVQEAIDIVAAENSFNSVVDFLENLPKWDGVRRVDRLLIDYLGAEDNAFTRESITKFLLAVVVRAYRAGAKFDSMLILQGRQGAGKSMLLRKLAVFDHWFVDSVTVSETDKDKVIGEKLKGKIIAEFAELAGMSKADGNALKAFITRQDLRYREAYGHTAREHLAKWVYAATTNDDRPINDDSGDRRFWVIPISTGGVKKPWELDRGTVLQIWAETMNIYRNEGCRPKLYLSETAQSIADHNVKNAENIGFEEYLDAARDFLDIPLPKQWNDWALSLKKSWLDYGYRAYAEHRELRTEFENITELQKRNFIRAKDFYDECSSIFPNSQNLQYNQKSKLHGGLIKDILTKGLNWENRTKNGIRGYYRKDE